MSFLPDDPVDLSTLAPLRRPIFLSLWLGTLSSNLGAMIQTVGASWLMSQLESSPGIVSLVQTAASLPLFLFALPAGAMGDLFDRRAVLLVAQAVAGCGAIILCVLTWAHLIGPVSLLMLTFVVASSLAVRAPVWQSSIGELVPRSEMPAGVALNSLSYNTARCVGPALGGVIVQIAGSAAAFGANAVSYLPLLVALIRWKPLPVVRSDPRQTVASAIREGISYLWGSKPMRAMIARGCAIGFTGGALWSLMPVVARDHIGGGSTVYGLMLASFGLGAILGSAICNPALRRLGVESTWRVAAASFAIGSVVLGLSNSLGTAALALLVSGAAWPIVLSTLTVVAQLEAPRPLVGRAVGAWQSTCFGCMAAGGVIWGQVATHSTTTAALVAAGVMLVMLIGMLARMPIRLSEQASVLP